MTKNSRQHKACSGCGGHFTTYRNYDYCVNCAVNNNRYVSKSNCSECDGSGIIKFRNQKPRPCKLCTLTKTPMNNQKKPKKLTLEQKQEQFWDEVDLLAQEKVYQLLTNNIPLPNLKLITEPYRYEDRQEKLTGLFLHKDVDFRTLLGDVENQYDEENLPDKEVMAEEVALWYCRMVIKSLISDLSDYPNYDPSFFENLTEN